MSPWAAPIVLVQKKTGDVRLCVDFRKLNAITKKDSFPLPRIDDRCTRFIAGPITVFFHIRSCLWVLED